MPPDTLAQEPLYVVPLDTAVVGSCIRTYDEVDSTNRIALQFGGDGSVFIADAQRAGRGRHGRSWHSAPGLGLWFSVAFDQPVDGLMFGACLAVRDALRPWIAAQIDWPNDLVAAGRKLCGILIERRNERTALGIGINVCHRPGDFPPELRGCATSVEAASGRPCSRAELVRAVLTALDEKVIVLRSGGVDAVRQEWIAACGVIGRRRRIGPLEGRVEAVDDTGALVIATPAGTRRVFVSGPNQGGGA
ncbi:MAG: biotin--[acetyl-CoA-carboxylase] ligase [Candidatus Hydrogenedentes bacterium]|nr:biotin--[acetyl-CoA-carboxylase] ligase [Candidatus Hydrogenedentota bacterium]